MDNFSLELSSTYGDLLGKLEGWLHTIILQIPNALVASLVAVIAYFLVTYIKKIAVRAVRKFTTNKTVLNLVANLTSVFIGLATLFLILSIFDLSSTINKILATAGVLGLAVGLALQDPMNNLFSGVFMSVRDLYSIGDLVETNDYFGTIKNIDLRATTLLLPTGQEVVIPNKEVIQKPLKNFTASGVRRVDIMCGVSYGDDLQKVESVVTAALQQLPNRLEHKPVDIVYTKFGDSSINFLARFWISTTDGQADFLLERSRAIKAVKSAFDENDIMIPFPITTLDFGIKGGIPMSKMLTLDSLRNEKQSQAS